MVSRLIVAATMDALIPVTGKNFGQMLRSWDAAWYLFVASHGYPSHPIVMTQWNPLAKLPQWAIAFFPGFPAATALVSDVGIPLVYAALAVSMVGGMVATLGVYRLGSLCFGSETGRRAALLFCFFPGALVFSWAYSEGLALAFAVWALCRLIERRWLTAGLFAALAGTVHSDLAVSLTVACTIGALVAVVRERDWRSLQAPLLAPVGLLGYLAYLQVHTGSWRNWTWTEKVGWGQHVDFGVHQITTLMLNIENHFWRGSLIVGGGFLVAALAAVALWRRPLPPAITAMAVISMLLAYWSSVVGFRPRALLATVPIFPAMAALLGRRGTAIALVLSAVATPFLLIAYLTNPALVP
ncbi:MAG TPA: mannosyltransferase family protein [Acidimicrobiales bacterium]|nr:mannosyltransferase family protein [Acidimicrobiales bacterium]